MLMAQYTLHEQTGLELGDLPNNPLEGVRNWVAAAREAGQIEPVAATLATADDSGMPAARICTPQRRLVGHGGP